MKLVSLAKGCSEDTLPQEVRDMQLKAEDMRLSSGEMIEKARTMVFDSGYQNAKALIYSHLDRFVEGTMSHLEEKQEQEYDIPAVTLSIGAAFSEQGFTDELFEQADKALYKAKESGRNRIYIFE